MRSWYANVLCAVMVAGATAPPAGSGFAGYLAQTPGAPQPAEAAQTPGPWADRGWVDHADMSYDNPKHRFHLVVPPHWVIAREDQFDSTFLWVMNKFNDAGNQRASFSIKICACQPKNAEQYFNDELAGWKQPQYASQYQVVSSGHTAAPGVYEIQVIINASKQHAREVFFLRNGTPYVVAFVWAADATPVELGELDNVRRAVGLPAARAMPAFRPAQGGAYADHGQ